jgi:hypothetical protein
VDSVETVGDPKFVDLSAKDFHLQAGSPAIDVGAQLSYTVDFDGNSMPVGPVPDLGAYEWR